jgi:hypothetical protein
MIACIGAVCGCAHGETRAIVDTLSLAAIIAVDVALATPPPVPLCAEDERDPPHTCPGTTASAPPPPAE